MHDRLRLNQGEMPEEVQLELLAPWYTQNTSESRTLDFFDAIPKYPFAVTTTIEKSERIEVPFTLRGKKYTAEIVPALLGWEIYFYVILACLIAAAPDVLRYLAEAFPQEVLNLPPRPHQKMKESEGA